jgi:hypothetical protein
MFITVVDTNQYVSKQQWIHHMSKFLPKWCSVISSKCDIRKRVGWMVPLVDSVIFTNTESIIKYNISFTPKHHFELCTASQTVPTKQVISANRKLPGICETSTFGDGIYERKDIKLPTATNANMNPKPAINTNNTLNRTV